MGNVREAREGNNANFVTYKALPNVAKLRVYEIRLRLYSHSLLLGYTSLRWSEHAMYSKIHRRNVVDPVLAAIAFRR